jgi:hypothetical protein
LPRGELAGPQQAFFDESNGLGAFLRFEELVVVEGIAGRLAKDEYVGQQGMLAERG